MIIIEPLYTSITFKLPQLMGITDRISLLSTFARIVAFFIGRNRQSALQTGPTLKHWNLSLPLFPSPPPLLPLPPINLSHSQTRDVLVAHTTTTSFHEMTSPSLACRSGAALCSRSAYTQYVVAFIARFTVLHQTSLGAGNQYSLSSYGQNCPHLRYS